MHAPINAPIIYTASKAAPAIATTARQTSLIDPFARQLSYLRLSVTDLCNFSCNYCLPNGYQGKKTPDELTVPEITTLLAAFGQLGIQKVRITGGEPSLRRDLVDIITVCKSSPYIHTIALTTNGYQLAQLAPSWISAGLNTINISIDSFNPAQFAAITGMDILPSIVQGIDMLLSRNFNAIKINAVLMQDTAQQTLADALAFVKERPISVRFIELMQTQKNHQVFYQQHLTAQQLQQQLLQAGWRQCSPVAHAGPAMVYSHADYAGTIGLIAPYADNFCATCNRLRVSSVGDMHLCLFDSAAFSLRPWLQSEDIEGLVTYIKETLQAKPQQHQLHQNNSGLITNLSMLGG